MKGDVQYMKVNPDNPMYQSLKSMYDAIVVPLGLGEKPRDFVITVYNPRDKEKKSLTDRLNSGKNAIKKHFSYSL